MRPRVFILGLDGADDLSVGAALRAGRMPHLARLINDKTHPLRSTPLPITPAAWTSAYTGYNPGKTGVLTFQRRVPNTYRGRIVTSADVGDRGFHTHLTASSKKVISVGFPMMAPPPQCDNSIIISGWDTPPSTDLANDAGAARLLAELNYRIDDEFSTDTSTLRDGIATRFTLVQTLMERNDWDCAMLYLGFIDGLGHRLGFGNEQTQELLAETDAHIGILAQRFPEDTAFIVCSDHGFGGFERSFSVTQWLEEAGYLTLRSRTFRNANSGGVPGLEIVDLESGIVDWSQTRAFCWDAVGRHAAIALNVKGQYPSGIVNPRDVFSLAGTLIDDLRAATDSHGAPIARNVSRREELFWGPNVAEFPEIFLETVEGTTAYIGKRRRIDTGFELEQGILHEGNFSSHNDDGLWGSSFDVIGNDLHVEDLAATVYALLEAPIPVDCDGINRSPKLASVAAETPAYSPEEEEIVRKRLEDLGYL